MVRRLWGINIYAINNLQLGAGIGIEDANKHPLRLSSMIWLSDKKWYILSLFEDGGSGKWHQINAIYRFNKYIHLGMMEEKFTGFGPRLKLMVPNFPVSIWFSSLMENKSQNFYFALKYIL